MVDTDCFKHLNEHNNDINCDDGNCIVMQIKRHPEDRLLK